MTRRRKQITAGIINFADGRRKYVENIPDEVRKLFAFRSGLSEGSIKSELVKLPGPGNTVDYVFRGYKINVTPVGPQKSISKRPNKPVFVQQYVKDSDGGTVRLIFPRED